MRYVHFEKYRLLVNEIDKQTKILSEIHREHLLCKNGCDLCCIDFSIFPVEHHFILNEIKNETLQIENSNDKNACLFLKNHSCSIYKYRPIMCRTHGLPLLYTNDEGDFELSVCELNFNKFDYEDFTLKNTLQQDKYNSKLFLLNRDFISDFKEVKYNETDLIPMKSLAEKNKKNRK